MYTAHTPADKPIHEIRKKKEEEGGFVSEERKVGRMSV